MRAMTTRKAHKIDVAQWLPAERIGQMTVDAKTRPWLIGKGLLTLRLRAAYGENFSLKEVDQWTGLLSEPHQAALECDDTAGLFREVEMRCHTQVCVFAQTVMPDSTLCVHPWLAELGDSSLGETLSDLAGVERRPYEYAWLAEGDALAQRALKDAEVKPSGLWARRSRIELRGAPLLVHEVFMPAMGSV